MKKIISLALFSTLVALFSLTANAKVWEPVEQWSAEWEKTYETWVKTEWDIHFFERQTLSNGRPNPYAGLRLDCADTVYAMRVIFAYENKLPFVFQDPTTADRTISHLMSRWNSKPAEERIVPFLNYLKGVVSTSSLPNDTYPVAITREAVHAGGLILTVRANHHSWTIKDILPIGVPHLVFNSVLGAGNSALLQERQSWPNPAWVFEGNQTPSGHAGFRYFKPTDQILSPAWEIPGYSEEQYHVPVSDWNQFAQERLATQVESDDEKLHRLLNVACDGLKGRVVVVADAVKYVQEHPQCMDYSTYDNFSTPSRDQRVFDDIRSLRKTYSQILAINGGAEVSQTLRNRLEKIFPRAANSAAEETASMNPPTIDADSVCTVEYRSGAKLDLAIFKYRLYRGAISNNPLDELKHRWGETTGSSALALECPSWDPWSPDVEAE